MKNFEIPFYQTFKDVFDMDFAVQSVSDTKVLEKVNY